MGYAYGAKNYARLNETIKAGFTAMFSYVIVAFVVVELLAGKVFYLFASDMELVNAGTIPLRIVIMFIFLVPLTMYTSSMFQSIGYAKEAIITSIIKVIVVIPVVYILSNIFGTAGVFASLAAADFITAMICLSLLLKIIKQFRLMRNTEALESY